MTSPAAAPPRPLGALRRVVPVVALLAVVLPLVPARAATNPSHQYISQPHVFYAYTGAGDDLDVSFGKANSGGKDVTITARGPGGVTHTCLHPRSESAGSRCNLTDLTAPQAGIWRIDFSGNSTNYVFTMDVQNNSTTVPGRVWTEILKPSQSSTTGTLNLWYASQEGYRYKGTYKNYNGINSEISADATGVAFKDTCVSAYQSADYTGPYNDTQLWRPPAGQCGDPYKIFFEKPDTGLPGTATRWDGTTTWIAPDPKVPQISSFRFAGDSDSIHSGTFDFDVTNFTGQLTVQVDTNDDGDYRDTVDVTLPAAAEPGPVSVPFDGKDSDGYPIAISRHLNARVSIEKVGEIHFTLVDVERRDTISVVALNGPAANSATLYWNDTPLRTEDRNCTTADLDGRRGFDSTDGVHGWTCANNANSGVGGSWGDARLIDDWTYGAANVSQELSIAGQLPELAVTKTVTSPPTPIGNGRYRLGYTINVLNHTAAAGAYSLEDTFAFGAGVGIVSAAVTNTVPGGIATTAGWNGVANTVVVSGQSIAGAKPGAPTAHTYTVDAVVTVPAGISEAAADCVIGAGEAGTGLLNRTTFSGTLGMQETEACALAPWTAVDKELVDVRRLGANRFDLVYSIVVQQAPAGDGVYDLTDSLKLGTPVSVTAASVTNSSPGSIAVNQSWNGASETSIARAVEIDAGDTHTYDVRISVTLDTAAVTPGNADCLLTGGETGTGALNAAAIAVNGVTREDSACVPFPAVSVAKTVTSPPAPEPDGAFRVEYTLRVRNTGPEEDTYDLEDSLAFTDAVTVVSTTIENSEPGTVDVNPNWRQGTPPDRRIATGVPIGAATATGATTHLYTLSVVFRVADGVTAAQADCTLAPGEAGTGLRNNAASLVGGDPTPADTCVEVPRTVLDKELVSMTPQGGGKFAVRYRLTVDRYGNGEPYTLNDRLRFGAPVTVESVKAINTAPGSVAVNAAWNGGSDSVLAAAVPMADGARHVYTVDVATSVKPGPAGAADRDCVLAAGEPGSGFTNTAGVTGAGLAEEDRSCAEVPKIDAPPPVRITKETVGVPTVNGDGTASAVYRLRVTNPGAEPATYTLTDQLQPGKGLTVTSASAHNTAPGGIDTAGGWNGTTNTTLVTDQPIAAGAIHTYTVTIQAALPAPTPGTQLDCALDSGESATGLRNTATAASQGTEQTAEACAAADTVFQTSGDTGGTIVLPGTLAVPAPAAVGPTLPVTGPRSTPALLRTALALLVAGVALTTGMSIRNTFFR